MKPHWMKTCVFVLLCPQCLNSGWYLGDTEEIFLSVNNFPEAIMLHAHSISKKRMLYIDAQTFLTIDLCLSHGPLPFPSSCQTLSKADVLDTYSGQFSCSVVSNSLQPHEPQHARPSCPPPTPRVHRNPCPLNQWCHPTISSSAVPFSSCLQFFPASVSFQMSQLFTSGGQSIGVSAPASVLPMNTQD